MSFWSENPEEMDTRIIAAMIELGHATADEDDMDILDRWTMNKGGMFLEVANKAHGEFMDHIISSVPAKAEGK